MTASCNPPGDRAGASTVNVKDALQNVFDLRVPDERFHVEASRCHSASLDPLTKSDEQRGTILYLAYGSNLSGEKFRGSRGIRPLSQINVQVPTLRLTFDLPGIPYTEPCFANSATRDPNQDRPGKSEKSEKGPISAHETASPGYHKDNWHKGLIGVVYEVTPSDYAHIIATEGGGSGYQDILVDCYPFESAEPSMPVPQDPKTKPFKAHTLFAPPPDPNEVRSVNVEHFARPDPSYAQPSARYLKLITDGAAELCLPHEYEYYLHSIRPFKISTPKQRLGQVLLSGFWLPIIMFVFALGRIFGNKHGILPRWLQRLSAAVFHAVWISYDDFFRPVFGEGERSISDGGSPDWRSMRLPLHDRS